MWHHNDEDTSLSWLFCFLIKIFFCLKVRIFHTKSIENSDSFTSLALRFYWKKLLLVDSSLRHKFCDAYNVMIVLLKTWYFCINFSYSVSWQMPRWYSNSSPVEKHLWHRSHCLNDWISSSQSTTKSCGLGWENTFGEHLVKQGLFNAGTMVWVWNK